MCVIVLMQQLYGAPAWGFLARQVVDVVAAFLADDAEVQRVVGRVLTRHGVKLVAAFLADDAEDQ